MCRVRGLNGILVSLSSIAEDNVARDRSNDACRDIDITWKLVKSAATSLVQLGPADLESAG